MSDARRAFGLVVSVFVALGVATGILGAIVVDWARVQFVVGAENVGRLGPTLVALAAAQTTGSQFLLGVAVAGLVGAMAGSRLPRRRMAGLVGGGGSLVGFYLMAGIGVALVTSVGGPGTGQVYDPGQFVGRFVLAGVPAALAGGAGGVAGTTLVR